MTKRFIGVVLSSNNFGDSDKFFAVFTRELGLVNVVGKGVRKLNSKRSPSLDTCNLTLFSLKQTRDGYYYVNEAKLVDEFFNIKSNLVVSGWVYYILEVLKNVSVAGIEDLLMFDNLVNTLKVLNKKPSKRVVYVFLQHVIVSAGVWDESFYKDYPYLKYINSNISVSKQDQSKIDMFFTDVISDLIEKDINSKKFLSSL